jgi:hypothetical protein
MPQMKKMSVEEFELKRIAETKNSAKIKLTPEEIFDKVSKKNHFRKYHFQAIICGDTIHLFNGIGIEVMQFENSHKGEINCRVFALEEIFLKTPIEKRNVGGYKIDFVKD